MAATWEIEITVTDLANRRISVTGTRTDGEDIQTYSLETHKGDGESLAAMKTRIQENLRAHADAAASKTALIAALIGTAEADIASALNAEEVV